MNNEHMQEFVTAHLWHDNFVFLPQTFREVVLYHTIKFSDCLLFDAVCQESLVSIDVAWQAFTDEESGLSR